MCLILILTLFIAPIGNVFSPGSLAMQSDSPMQMSTAEHSAMISNAETDFEDQGDEVTTDMPCCDDSTSTSCYGND